MKSAASRRLSNLFWLLGVLACGDDDDVPSAAGTQAATSPNEPGGSGARTSESGAGGGHANGGASGHAGGGGASERGQASAGTSGRSSGDVTFHDGSADDAGTRELRDVRIRFRGLVAGRKLACGETYDGLGKTKARATPHDFRFFVQGVRLLDASGKATTLEFAERAPFQTRDVGLIDFTDDQGECDSGDGTMNLELTGRAAPGATTRIELTLGVPEKLNHQSFAVAKAPLADASTYWGWANGYRFFMAVLDAAPSAERTAADGGVLGSSESLLHVGSGGCSGSNAGGFTCARPNRARIVLDDFDPERDAITADLAQLFTEVDVASGIECHGFAPGCDLPFAALGLDRDGQNTEQQRVFAVVRAE
jgi:uncharacterized repeat protein (TIGR04052 family)